MNNPQAYANLLQKAKVGTPATYADIATAIDNEPAALFKFLLDNDLPQIATLLHQSDSTFSIGENATLTPDKARCAGELQLLNVNSNWTALNQVIQNFVVNMSTVNWTTKAEILAALQAVGATSQTPAGLQFNYKFA
jgi:hypothetical protein